MTAAPGSVAAPPTASPSRRIMQVVLALAGVLLAYQAIHFWISAPLHYLTDFTASGFKEYWPRRWWLVFHIGGGTLALFMGPFQFWSGLKRTQLQVHRLTGQLYVIGIAVGCATGFYMSTFTTPADFGIALFMLSAAWCLTTGMAMLAIKRRRIEQHKQWMIRSYVVTFAFVAFRYLVELPVFDPLGAARASTVGWLSWVAPLLVAEVVLQWPRTMERTSPGT